MPPSFSHPPESTPLLHGHRTEVSIKLRAHFWAHSLMTVESFFLRLTQNFQMSYETDAVKPGHLKEDDIIIAYVRPFAFESSAILT